MISVRRLTLLACIGVGVLVVGGCRRDRARDDRSSSADAGTTTTTSAEIRLMTESATDRIATASCEREVTCDHVGPARRHASVEACTALNKSESAKHLNPQACPRGINQAQLVDCVAAIERASCVDPIGAIIRIEECRTSKLCLTGQGP